MIRRLVVHPILESSRSVLLIDPTLGVVMRVVVALPVTEGLRSAVMGVSKMGGDLTPGPLTHVSHGPPQRDRDPVRLGSRREMNNTVRQIELGLR